MTILEAIKQRHSVRSYTDRPIDAHIKQQLEDEIAQCNNESGLHFRLVTDDTEIFDSLMAHYGKFSGVRNCIIVAGPKCDDFRHQCGYYGERIVLKAQMLGLNTCWVGMTFSKKKAKRYVADGDSIACVIAIGYGETQGSAHKIKSYADVCDVTDADDSFRRGVEAALLAPTSMNSQKFKISVKDGNVVFKAGFGMYTAIDLGIVRYHFEIGSNN
jgi:nitroreductase